MKLVIVLACLTSVLALNEVVDHHENKCYEGCKKSCEFYSRGRALKEVSCNTASKCVCTYIDQCISTLQVLRKTVHAPKTQNRIVVQRKVLKATKKHGIAGRKKTGTSPKYTQAGIPLEMMRSTSPVAMPSIKKNIVKQQFVKQSPQIERESMIKSPLQLANLSSMPMGSSLNLMSNKQRTLSDLVEQSESRAHRDGQGDPEMLAAAETADPSRLTLRSSIHTKKVDVERKSTVSSVQLNSPSELPSTVQPLSTNEKK